MTFTRNSDYFPKLHYPCRLYNSDAAYFLLGGKLIFYALDQGVATERVVQPPRAAESKGQQIGWLNEYSKRKI